MKGHDKRLTTGMALSKYGDLHKSWFDVKLNTTVYSNGHKDVNITPRSIMQRGTRNQLTQPKEFASRAQFNGTSVPDNADSLMSLTHPSFFGVYSPS